MIDARELRIGNFICDTFGRWIKIDSINIEGINILASDDGKPYGLHSAIIETEHSFSDLFGIPLTEDILIKAGFNIDSLFGTQSLCKKDGIEIWSYRSDNKFLCDNIKRKSVYIKYLHQLQNIYWCLCGTELEIKL